MRVLLLLTLYCAVLSAQSIQIQSDPALLTQPGQEIELRARVVSASGAPLGNTEVFFVGPNRVDYGQFPAATNSTQTWIAARTDATGVVSARYRTGSQPGFALLNASILSASATISSVSYAVTNGIAAPSTALTPVGLRDAVRQAFLSGAAESSTQRVHGPFLFPAGTVLNPAVTGPLNETYFPRTMSAPEWFLWIDDNALAGFSHGVRYLRVPIGASASQVSTQTAISFERWWPVARLASGRSQSLLGAETENDVRRLPAAAAGRFASGQRSAAPADACLVLVRGPGVSLAAEGLGNAANSLIERELVPSENVFTRSLEGPDGRVVRAMDRATLDKIFEQMKQKPCRKIYFLYDGHGSPADWGGGLCLVSSPASEAEYELYSYEDLAKRFQEQGNVQVEMILSACFSGQAVDWMQGLGFTGEVLTVSSATQVGWQQTMYRYIAPSLAKSNQTFQGVLNDLKTAPADYVRNANPQLGAISATGNRRMTVPYTFLPFPITATAYINRPATAQGSTAFRANFMPALALIGDYSPRQITLAGGVSSLPIGVVGLSEGITAIQGTAMESAAAVVNYAGNGQVQVGTFKVIPSDCLLNLGGTNCQVLIERIIPIADMDNGGVFEIRVFDPLIAGVSLTEISFATNQRSATFSISPIRVGQTFVKVIEKQSGSSQLVDVRVSNATTTSATPTSCAGSFPFLLTTIRSNAEHTCCTNEVQNFPLTIVVNSNGTVTSTGDGRNFPQVFNGTVSLNDCRITLRGTMPVSTFQTQSTLTGQIVPAETLGNAAGRAVNFDGLRFEYRMGTDGALPGGQPAIFSGTGRFAGSSACTYELSSSTLQVNTAGATQSVDLRTGASCAWTAARTGDFLTVLNTSGTGPARIYFRVATNSTNATRSGSVSVGGRTLSVTQAGLPAGAPVVSGVVNGASFGAFISSGSWVTITGTNLATTTRTWAGPDFVGNQLPASLDGVGVTIDGKPALVYFVSPGQLNVLAPDGITEQDVAVVVRRGAVSSNPFIAKARDLSSGFFLLDVDGRRYPAAVHADGTLVGRPGLYQGLATRAAKPGDIILLYLTGLGETIPATPADRLVSGAPVLRDGVSVKVGSAPATVLFSGKVSSGLYQINLQMPDVPAGDQPLEASINGRRTQAGVSLTVAGQ